MSDIQLSMGLFFLIMASVIGFFGSLLANLLTSDLKEILNRSQRKKWIWIIISVVIYFLFIGLLLYLYLLAQ